MPRGWKTVCVRDATYDRLDALRRRLDAAFLDSPTAAVVRSDKRGEVTLPATIDRLLDFYERYLDRRTRSRGKTRAKGF